MVEVEQALQKMQGQLAERVRVVQEQHAAALHKAEQRHCELLLQYQEQQQQLEQQVVVAMGAKAECEQLKERCEALEGQGRECEEMRERSEQQAVASNIEVALLKGTCSELEARLATAKQGLTSSTAELTKLQHVARRKVAVACRRAEIGQRKLAAVKQRLHGVVGEGSVMRQKAVMELQQQLQHSEAVAGELQQQLVTRDSELQQLVAAVAEQQKILEDAVARAGEVAGLHEALEQTSGAGVGLQVGMGEGLPSPAPAAGVLGCKRAQVAAARISSSSSGSWGGVNCNKSRDYVELMGRASSLGIMSRPGTADAALLKLDQQQQDDEGDHHHQQQQQQQEEGLKKSMRTRSAPDMLTLCCSSGLTVDLPATAAASGSEAVAELPWGLGDGVKAKVLVLEQRDSPKAVASPNFSAGAWGAYHSAGFSEGGFDGISRPSDTWAVAGEVTASAIEVLGTAVASAAEALTRGTRQVTLLSQQSTGLHQQLQQVAAAAAVAGELLEQQAAAAAASDAAWVAERGLLVEMKQKMQQERAAAQQELNRGRMQLEGMVQERNNAAAQRIATHHLLIAAQQQVEEQERKLLGFKAHIAEQEKQVAGFRVQVRELQQQVAVAHEAGEKLQREVGEKEGQAEGLRVQVLGLQEQLSEAQAMVTATKEREEVLHQQLQVLQQEVCEGQGAVQAAKVEEEKMEQRLRQLQQQLVEESAAAAVAGDVKGQLQQELAVLQQQFEDATAELDVVREREEGLREALGHMTGQLGLAIRHLDEGGLKETGLRARLEVLAEEMAVQLGLLVLEREERMVEAEQWKEEVATKTQQLAELHGAVAVVQVRVCELQQQLETVTQEAAAAKAQVREVTGELGLSQAREQELRGQLLGLEGELEEMREREGVLQQQLGKLGQQLQQQQQQSGENDLTSRGVSSLGSPGASTASPGVLYSTGGVGNEGSVMAAGAADGGSIAAAASAAADDDDDDSGSQQDDRLEREQSLLRHELSDAEEELTVGTLNDLNQRLTAVTQKQLEAEQEVQRARTVHDLQEEQLQELRQQLMVKEQQVAALQNALVSSQMGLLQMHSSLGQAKASLKGTGAASPGHRQVVTSEGGCSSTVRRESGSSGGGVEETQREEGLEWGPWMGGDGEPMSDVCGTSRVWKVSGCFGEGGLIYDNPLGQGGMREEGEVICGDEGAVGDTSMAVGAHTEEIYQPTATTAAEDFPQGFHAGNGVAGQKMFFISPSDSCTSRSSDSSNTCGVSGSGSLDPLSVAGDDITSSISFISPLPRITPGISTKDKSLAVKPRCSNSGNSSGGGSSSSSSSELGRTISAVKGPATPQAAIVYQRSRSMKHGATGNVSIQRRPCWPSEEGSTSGSTSEVGDASTVDAGDHGVCAQPKARLLLRDATMQKHSMGGCEENIEVMLPCAPCLEEI
jgi:chromosome segregation ATPase